MSSFTGGKLNFKGSPSGVQKKKKKSKSEQAPSDTQVPN